MKEQRGRLGILDGRIEILQRIFHGAQLMIDDGAGVEQLRRLARQIDGPVDQAQAFGRLVAVQAEQESQIVQGGNVLWVAHEDLAIKRLGSGVIPLHNAQGGEARHKCRRRKLLHRLLQKALHALALCNAWRGTLLDGRDGDRGGQVYRDRLALRAEVKGFIDAALPCQELGQKQLPLAIRRLASQLAIGIFSGRRLTNLLQQSCAGPQIGAGLLFVFP